MSYEMSWWSERHQRVRQSWSEVPSECGCVVQECTEIHEPRCSMIACMYAMMALRFGCCRTGLLSLAGGGQADGLQVFLLLVLRVGWQSENSTYGFVVAWVEA